MAKINLLDSSIYNLLSAGEVVENPASVVKELVENSIDAGATEISVSITGGGIKSICVTDNGTGIEPDELEKAVLPHATSKIGNACDLQSIATLGFRGEALPSIGAVSELEIKSKYIDEDYARAISVKGGQITALHSAPLAKGTSVKVSNLFFNTPARLKFLKSAGAEQAAVSYTLRNLAFSHPHIAFKYIQDNIEVFATSGNGLENAILSLYGRDITDHLIKVSGSDGAVKVEGFISSPKLFKNNRRFQTLIINSRLLSNQEITAAIHNAYSARLMTRCYPVFVLDIIMPFDNVDVNVHPQKATVRFSDARSVCSACYHAVKNALEQYEQTQYLSFAGGNARIANEDIVGEQSKTKAENEHKDGIAERLAKAYKYLPENPIFSDNKSDRLSDRFSQPTINSISIPKTISSPPLPIKDITEPQKIDSGTDYKIIGQLFKTYILIENGEELILIDQHAAHERILFDKMLADFERDTPSQLLMMPYIYECSYDDVSYLKEIIPKLQKIGFDIDDFGDNHFKVNAIPLSIGNMDIHAFLDSVIRDKYSGKNEVLKEYLAKKCCKAAIKGGDELDNQIIEYVMDYFIKNSLPLHCPHGRPTLIKFKKREIETFFGRIK